MSNVIYAVTPTAKIENTGWVTAPTYPIFMPYKSAYGSYTPYSGKLPRLMSIAMTTLVLTHDSAYDPSTRTLFLSGSWQRLARQIKLLNGGQSRDKLADLLDAYENQPFPTTDGDIIVAESTGTAQTLGQRWVRFTPEYERLMTGFPKKPVPMEDMPHNTVELDLWMLAILYCPESQPLQIPTRDLSAVLPETGERKSHATLYRQSAKNLNDGQTRWAFTYEDADGLTITPADCPADAEPVILHATH